MIYLCNASGVYTLNLSMSHVVYAQLGCLHNNEGSDWLRAYL